MFCISAYIPCDNVPNICPRSLWQCSEHRPTFLVTIFCISAHIPCDNVLHIGPRSLWQCSEYRPTFLVTMFRISAHVPCDNVLRIGPRSMWHNSVLISAMALKLMALLITLLPRIRTMVWSPGNQTKHWEKTNDNSHNKHSASTRPYLFSWAQTFRRTKPNQ